MLLRNCEEFKVGRKKMRLVLVGHSHWFLAERLPLTRARVFCELFRDATSFQPCHRFKFSNTIIAFALPFPEH